MTLLDTKLTVGIPRTLLYYSFYPLWRRFLEELGARVVVSAPTTKETLDAGVEAAVTDACVPIKIMHGHVKELVQRVDYLFLPRVVCTNGRTVYCPKFLGLPDMIRSSVSRLPRLIDVRVDLRRGRAEASKVALRVGRLFTNQTGRIRSAYQVALAELGRYSRLLRDGMDPEAAMDLARRGVGESAGRGLAGVGEPPAVAEAALHLAVIGYPYVLHDPFLNLNLLEKLRHLGATPLTSQMVSASELEVQRAKLRKDLFWTYSDEAVSAAYHYLERPDKVDGLIHLTAFGCGPDSMVDKMIELRARELGAVPFMSLMIDEHTGEAGLNTRLEAFTDMLRRRRRPAATGAVAPVPAAAPATARPSRARRTTFARRPRVVTFPHAGNLPPIMAELVTALGNQVVLPPRPTQRTLSLGAAHAPEFACLPLKMLLGTYLEALEQGADTIISTGGVGPCRAGLYTQLQELVLRQLGHRVDVITLEPPRVDLRDFFDKIKALNVRGHSVLEVGRLLSRAWQKQIAVDGLERLSHHVRARQISPGSTTPVYEEALRQIYRAADRREVEEAFRRGETMLAAVPQKTGYQPLKVGIVGEIYVLIEPSSNFEIEETLGEMGVEVERSIYFSGWARESNLLGKPGEGKRIKAKDLAQPYLGEMIGGHGQDSVGNVVMYAHTGYDGVIQLAPFTCIPEIVAKSVLERVSRDYGLPVLSISLDEQTGKAGLLTRLEAFVDLLARRRSARLSGTRAPAPPATSPDTGVTVAARRGSDSGGVGQ